MPVVGFPDRAARRRQHLGPLAAVDLGTSTARVSLRGRGLVDAMPSVVVRDRRNGTVVAVGSAAAAMEGRTPGHLEVIRPLAGGVILDAAGAAALVQPLLRASRRRPVLGRTRAVVCAPANISDRERGVLVAATRAAGAGSVTVIDEPMAAAIGADLPIADARPSMIIDIGGGTTEAAIIASGGVVARTSVRVGGNDLDAAIVDHVARHLRVLIDRRSGEELKRHVVSAHRSLGGEPMSVLGVDRDRGTPITVTIDAAELRPALNAPLRRITAAVRTMLERTSPGITADLLDRGLVLSGGGALLRGLDRRLTEVFGLPVRRAPAPQRCVVRGAQRCLEHADVLDEVSEAG